MDLLLGAVLDRSHETDQSGLTSDLSPCLVGRADLLLGDIPGRSHEADQSGGSHGGGGGGLLTRVLGHAGGVPLSEGQRMREWMLVLGIYQMINIKQPSFYLFLLASWP